MRNTHIYTDVNSRAHVTILQVCTVLLLCSIINNNYPGSDLALVPEIVRPIVFLVKLRYKSIVYSLNEGKMPRERPWDKLYYLILLHYCTIALYHDKKEKSIILSHSNSDPFMSKSRVMCALPTLLLVD